MAQNIEPTPNAKFETGWRNVFDNTPPLGHLLRHDFHGDWTRFHALPNSKRYAETDDERKTILSRAHTLAMSCFDEDEQLWVVTGRYGEFDIENDPLISRLALSQILSWYDPDDMVQMAFFGVETIWRMPELDKLLTEIAEDNERVVFFSAHSKIVFAPYDGGFDIVSLRPQKIAELEVEFSEWMSDRADKL